MCPRCGSNVLLIKQAEGFEKFLVGITGKRSYRCRMCEATFRARDKRTRMRRAAPQASADPEQRP
jgi:DNA-directed RNA polymerase subunit RPC12/RpoP